MSKPILCIDFDGVIHSYDKGWQDGSIYGTVTAGFFEWAERAAELFTLTIYSSRSKESDGASKMADFIDKEYRRTWLNKPCEIPFLFASEKPPAFLTIDDRAICFMGDWSALDPEKLRAFKPWNVK